MAAKGLPIILAGGAALLLMGGKKKKKKKSGTGGGDTYIPDDETIPYYPPPIDPKQGDDSSSRPAGNPPRGDEWDANYWGSTTAEQLESIRRHFKQRGYPVEVTAHPMNILGPKGTVEMENSDGTMGKLGGDDDQPNQVVRKFQNDYNRVSRLNRAEKFTPGSMGGLATDGAVGPYTLNGLRHAKEVAAAAGRSWDDLLLMATNKGIS